MAMFYTGVHMPTPSRGLGTLIQGFTDAPLSLFGAKSIVVCCAAEKLFPGAFLMWCGDVGGAVEAALIEVDQPDLAGGADDKVAEVRVAQTHAKLEQTLPKFVN